MRFPSSFTKEYGFSLIEILIVTGIFTVLLTFTIINFPKTQSKTSIRTSVDTIIADIQQQQTKAMVGDTEGRGIEDSYGIFFQTNNYILFHGTSYVANNLSNSTIPLDTSVQFVNDTLSSTSLIFNKGSGEVINFANTSNSIGVKNINTGELKTITINRYGIITQVN